MIPRWLHAWHGRRTDRRELEERARAAERAARDAERRWPEVRSAADIFAREADHAVRPRTGGAST